MYAVYLCDHSLANLHWNYGQIIRVLNLKQPILTAEWKALFLCFLSNQNWGDGPISYGAVYCWFPMSCVLGEPHWLYNHSVIIEKVLARLSLIVDCRCWESFATSTASRCFFWRSSCISSLKRRNSTWHNREDQLAWGKQTILSCLCSPYA